MLNINLNLLKSFFAVYKSGGITKAAAMLNLAPPAVTYNIKQLEKQLGHKLFVTHKKGADPTDKAKEIFPQIETAFESLLQINIDNTQVLRIGTTSFHTDFYLLDFHREFMVKYPHIKLEFYHHPKHDYLTMLANNEIDIAVMQFLKKPSSQITMFELFSTAMSFYTTKEFAKQHNLGNEITFERFLQLPFICHSQSRTVLDRLESAFEHKLNATETPSVQVALDMVLNNQGIGILFDNYLDHVKDERIVRLRISDKPKPPDSVYQCAYHKKPSAPVALYVREIKRYYGVV